LKILLSQISNYGTEWTCQFSSRLVFINEKVVSSYQIGFCELKNSQGWNWISKLSDFETNTSQMRTKVKYPLEHEFSCMWKPCGLFYLTRIVDDFKARAISMYED
jgi:hypothetical protein